MSDAGDQQQFSAPPDAADVIGTQLMIAAVIFLFMVVVFVLILFLYAKYYIGARPSLRRGGSSGRFRFLFPPSSDLVPVPRRGSGLDLDILISLPITSYRGSDLEGGGLECSVCLSEVSDGEEVRLLPGCGHGFHVGCIDMWFHFHSNCPLCRSVVEMPAAAAAGGGGGGGGNPRMLAIDIPPRRAMEGFLSSPTSSLPTSRFSGEGAKTRPPTPSSGRLRSFRWLLNGGKRAVGSSCSPRGGDIEQGAAAVVGCAAGEGSSPAPETSTTEK